MGCSGSRKEMFYLTTHSTHFIYGYMASDILSTTQIVRGNPLPPHGLLFPINSRGYFICTITQTGVTPVVEHWLEREIALWVHLMKDRSDDPSHHDRTLLPRRYISLRSGSNAEESCSVRLFNAVPPVFELVRLRVNNKHPFS